MNAPQSLEVPGYQVLEFLGNGASSSIWKVRDACSGEIVALKRVVRREAKHARFIEQAENEYSVGRGMENDTIRRIWDIRRIKRWFTVQELHLIMEYCPGVSIQERRPTSVLEVTRVFLAVAQGLAYMNAQGFVHADIKPNNIIVGESGQVKVIDLGQSCPIGTVKKRIQGTPDFIAPEQVQCRPLDARTDVFNFGASLYWALTGKAIPTVIPKKSSGRDHSLHDTTLTPPEQINPEVTAPLSALVTECVSRRPIKRPSSMDKVASRLDLVALSLQRVQSAAGTTPAPAPEGR
jgi:serine/threonine-protein kinase